jgi:integrase
MAITQKFYQGIVDDSIPHALLTTGGFRPSWLLDRYEYDEWNVTNIGDQSPKTIVFNVTLAGGAKLSSYPNLYESIKRIAYGVRTGPLAEVESAGAHVVIVNNLITLARWMISNGIERFSMLTKEDRAEYAAAAVYGTQNILNSESLLERHLEALIERCDFQPDDSENTRRSKSKSVFPVKKVVNTGTRVILDRTCILRDAGLEQVGLGRNGVLSSLLDEAEILCGFNPIRKKKRVSAKSKDDYDEQPVTEEHLRRFLMSFKYLYTHRRYLEDAPSADPFAFTSPRLEAKKLGAAIGRTGTVPVKQATHLIERSIRWILDYSPKILDLKDQADQAFDKDGPSSINARAEYLNISQIWPTGPASPFPILAARVRDIESDDESSIENFSNCKGMNLQSATLSLMSACAVVIAAFTARRASEIIGLRVGCVHIDDAGNPWLKCFIHKTTQMESYIPIPEVVIFAVNVLERISERSRNYTGTPYLFQYNVPGTCRTHGISGSNFPNFDIQSHLRKFGYFVDVPRMEDGSLWTFKPHQFRRFFAILYIWIYDKGDWGALQYHLRHFTNEMTRRYVTESEIGQIVALANKEHTAEILANAAFGITHLAGVEGERFKNIAQDLRRQMTKSVEVISERKFKQKLEKLVERTGLSLVAFPWGYCVERKTAQVRVRNCTNTEFADYERANEITCVGCDCNLVTPSAQHFLATAIQLHRDVADAPDSPAILRKASQAISQRFDDALAKISPWRGR